LIAAPFFLLANNKFSGCQQRPQHSKINADKNLIQACSGVLAGDMLQAIGLTSEVQAANPVPSNSCQFVSGDWCAYCIAEEMQMVHCVFV